MSSPFFQTSCLFFFFFFFPPTVYCQHDDLWPAGQPITAGVFHQTGRLNLRVRAGEFEPQSSHCNLEKKSFHFYIIAAYVRRVCICCLWRVDIAVQCCQFPVFSEMLQWFREEENIQRTYFGWTCHWWVCSRGVLIQYNVMRRRSTAIRGRGEVKKSSPHGTEDLLFSSSSSLVLLWGLGRCALRLAVLSGGGFAAPGGVVAQSRGAVEVVLVVQAVSGVVLRVLQTSDQTLILVAELAAHQGRLAHHHHVLEREADTKEGGHKCCCKKVTPCLSCVALQIHIALAF